MRFVGCVINICTQSVQRNATFTIPLGTRNFGTPETTTNLNLDAFGSLTHSVLYRTLHSATEHHTTLQLSGNVLRYQASIQIRLADFFDVDVHRRSEEHTSEL